MTPLLLTLLFPLPADPTFDEVEREVQGYMKVAGCKAATLAVSRDGRLLLSRSYGHADREGRVKTSPNALFRIGSIAKPITAAVVKELIRDGKLSLDTKVFELLNLDVSSRHSRITVRHLIEHQGGWDSQRSYDPVFREQQVRSSLKLKRPVAPDDIVRWFLPRALDFDPGTQSAYSNFGYCVLGRVVEKVTAKKFEAAMSDFVLKPNKIEDIRVARTLTRDRPAREVWYPVSDARMSLEVLDSCAGLTASAPALCAFMRHYWLNGERREEGTAGQWIFVGSLHGTTAVVMQRADGVDVAALFNNRRDDDLETDKKDLVKRLVAAVDASVKK